MNLRTILGLFILTNLLLLSCKTVKLNYPEYPGDTNTPSGAFLAGAAQVDMTPPPGYPMAGFGSAGRFSRGFWTHLYAKATYIEDTNGNFLVIVACDLWGVTSGLVDQVIKRLREAYGMSQLGRENLLISATHTHHSHGNIASSPAYNIGATIEEGFDEDLFYFTTDKIAKAINTAYNNRTSATATLYEGSIAGLVRNRSYDAFNANPDKIKNQITTKIPKPEKYFSDDLPSFVCRKEELQAVDSSISVIRIDATNRMSPPIAVINFTAFHPTTMGPAMELNSSDIFGVAATELKNRKKWEQTVVSFINGAEGDISANWLEQNKVNTVTIGRAIATRVTAALSRGGTQFDGAITHRYTILPMINQPVDISSSYPGLSCNGSMTAKNPKPGVATLGGTEDGRTALYYQGLKEGLITQDCDEDHGFKPSGVTHIVKDLLNIESKGTLKEIIEAVGSIYLKNIAPKETSLSIHDIGSVTIVSLPGEFTVAMGTQIRNSVFRSLRSYGGKRQKVLLAGLTNDYLSYFTTPSEYNMQHYEGASTMYGTVAGVHIEKALEGLVKKGESYVHQKRRKYKAGDRFKKRYFAECKPDKWIWQESLAGLLEDDVTGKKSKKYPIFFWDGKVPSLSPSTDFSNVQCIPQTWVEVKDRQTQEWRPLKILRNDGIGNSYEVVQSDHQCLTLASGIQSCNGDQAKWFTIWTPPSSLYLNGQKVRFAVKRPNTTNPYYSPEFILRDVLDGTVDNEIRN